MKKCNFCNIEKEASREFFYVDRKSIGGQAANFFEWYPTHESYSKLREHAIIKYLNYKQENIQQLALII